MSDLKGNVAIITGSSSGIGAGIAEHFASLGCRVTLTGRRQEALDLVKEKCLKKGLKPDEVLTVAADVCKSSDLDRIVSETVGKFGQINYLINNAGVVTFKGIRLMTEEEYDAILNTNLKAAQFLSKKALPYLIESKGNIVNMSSTGSQEVVPWCATYCMSKAAMDLMTKCMAADFSVDGVRVNAVNPGLIKTPIMDGTGIDELLTSEEFNAEYNLVGRMGEVREVANMVSFLCSDVTGGFITGSCLLIDGGFQSMRRPAPSMVDKLGEMVGYSLRK